MLEDTKEETTTITTITINKKNIMFTAKEKLFIRNSELHARWRAAMLSVNASSMAPTSVALWELLINGDLLRLAIYLVLTTVIVSLNIICAGKIAHYKQSVERIRMRLDHPPNRSERLE